MYYMPLDDGALIFQVFYKKVCKLILLISNANYIKYLSLFANNLISELLKKKKYFNDM